MSLLRYEPWSGSNVWSGDVFRLIDSVASRNAVESAEARAWEPRVDIVEFEDHYDIQADLPGINPETVDITLENKQLSIAGERAINADVEKAQQHRLERPAGKFIRRFNLPLTADFDNIQARSEHGVVYINIPKRSPAQAVKINIAA